MKKLLLLITYNVSLIAFCTAQNPLVKQWDYRFGGTSNEALTSFRQTSDGGYILGGYSFSDISGDKTQVKWGSWDYWIVKIDSLGNKQWDKDYGGTDSDLLYTLQQTTDGGYILGGSSFSDSSGNKTHATWGSSDYWMVKIDSLGNKQWDKDFGGTDDDRLISLQQTSDKGYILGGYSYSGISGDKTQPNWDTSGIITSDFWIIKTDSLGNKQWDRDFGGKNNDFLNSLQQTADGGYLLGGPSKSGNNGNKTQATWGGYDYWILKIDSLGNKQWDKDFGGTNVDELFSLKQTSDGGFILGGWSLSGSNGNKTQASWGGYDYWIVKIDSLGKKQWDKDFGGILYEDEFGNVSQTTDGGYLIAGSSYSDSSGNKTENNLGQEQSWIIKTDSLGNKQWDKTLLTPGHDENSYAIQTKDGCFAMANYTNGGIGGYKTQSAWNNSYDYWIIKFCDTTSTTSITQISDNPNTFSIYPNPAKELLVISDKALGKREIEIYNLFGRRVLLSELGSKKSEVGRRKTEMTINISSLSPGIYFLRAGNEVMKFVKE